MSNRTPGPWETYEFDDQIGVSGNYADVADCTGLEYRFDSSRSREEILANARLIAAAPDLLEALKALLFNATHGNGLEAHYRAQDDARAAIAKAEGKS
jgi:hypothetical protein